MFHCAKNYKTLKRVPRLLIEIDEYSSLVNVATDQFKDPEIQGLNQGTKSRYLTFLYQRSEL